ncbi:hypothetical protein V6N13_058058 [Hibiscus sabdariffa]
MTILIEKPELALHKEEAYMQFLNDEDKENMKWLRIFNKYDLYSKSKVPVDVEKVKPYYLSLIEKMYSISLLDFILVLFILPFAIFFMITVFAINIRLIDNECHCHSYKMMMSAIKNILS